jgi:hypothetical protein
LVTVSPLGPSDLEQHGGASDGRGGLWAPASKVNGTSWVYHPSSSGRWNVQRIGTTGTGIHAIAANPGIPAFPGGGIAVRRTGIGGNVWKIG